MSVYKRSKSGPYWYKFRWRGRLIRESTKQHNKQAARDIRDAHRTALAKGEFGLEERPTAPTLFVFCDRIEKWAKARFEKTVPKNWAWYEYNLKILRKSSFASKKLDQITNEDVAKFVSKRFAEDRLPATINSTIRVLRRIMNLAVEWRVISLAPKLETVPGERHRERVLKEDEEERYLNACADDLRVFMCLLLDTGLRPWREAAQLDWGNVLWDQNKIFVASGKTPAARRYVPMLTRTRRFLEWLWDKAGKPTAEVKIFPANTSTKVVDGSTFKKAHAKALKESGVPPFCVYTCRHTFLTRLGTRPGMDPWTFMKIAGHSNISQSQRYVHPSMETVNRAMEEPGLKAGHASDSTTTETLPTSPTTLLSTT